MHEARMKCIKKHNFDFDVYTKPYIDILMSENSCKIIIKVKWNKNNIIQKESKITFFNREYSEGIHKELQNNGIHKEFLILKIYIQKISFIEENILNFIFYDYFKNKLHK